MGVFCLGAACVSQVTLILDAIQHGDSKASEELLPLIYEELRWPTARRLAREAPGQTLQPTVLVHEARVFPRIAQESSGRLLVADKTSRSEAVKPDTQPQNAQEFFPSNNYLGQF
jgi:hypothetical protein